MALFGKKKVDAKKGAPKKAMVVSGAPRIDARDLASVIVRPIITEKAAVLGEKNVYAFEIARSAGKRDVIAAVKKLWNVTPVKVGIVNRKPREITSRARAKKSVYPGLKKAYIYLKEGDRIELV